MSAIAATLEALRAGAAAFAGRDSAARAVIAPEAALAVARTTALGQHGDAVEHRSADDGRADHQVAGHNLHVADNATSEPGHEPVG